MVWPTMERAPTEERKTATLPMSSGFPRNPTGICLPAAAKSASGASFL
jgi:hypothetical protein